MNKKDKSISEIIEVISGRKAKQKQELEELFQKKLVEILPRKSDEKTNEFVKEIEKIQEDISIKKADALGMSLINVIKKSAEKINKDIPDVKIETVIRQEIIHDLNLSGIVKTIVSAVVEETDNNYEKIFQLAVGAVYKYFKQDLVKILCKEKDVLQGKIKYYEAKYNYVGGGADFSGADTQELEDEIDRLNQIITELSSQLPCPIYKTWGDFTVQTWGGVIR